MRIAARPVGLARTAGLWRRLRRDPLALGASAFLLALVVVGLTHSLIEPYEPNRQAILDRLQGPSADHWLGTDALGRDHLSRLMAGTSVTLRAALLGTLVAALGAPLGLLAGYVRGKVDLALGIIADALLSIPPLLLAFGIVGFLGPGLTNAVVGVGVVLAPRFFRVARTAARSVGNQTFMEAARSVGCAPARLFFRHLVPNAAGPLIVQASVTVGTVVAAESGLSFLGLGVQPPQSTWGGMLRDAFALARTRPFALIAPSVMITLTILATFLLADTARDPRVRSRDRRERS